MAVIGAPAAARIASTPAVLSPRSGAGGFTMPPASVGTGAPPGIARTVATTAIGGAMVLALQEQLGREHADREARRHGHRVLDELARLQRALLSVDDVHGLDGLAELARVETRDADPALAAVLSSIRLRARIELERRARSHAGPDAG